MRLLLDTHVLLWAIDGHSLSSAASQAFLDPVNELFFSAASYWEICIKASLGKLALKPDWISLLDREMAVNQIQWLPIGKDHCQRLLDLPFIHGDPFDRLLIVQAQAEDMTLLTSDGNIKRYDVSTLW